MYALQTRQSPTVGLRVLKDQSYDAYPAGPDVVLLERDKGNSALCSCVEE